ncbi:MAG: baseplate J/gp47 family protein [Candidatus Solibacter sp.]|nr:baseplate J/gp47 family protein [Candidatus Solibacter sp.]
MSEPVADLTRWNRAGLPHFRYVGGNAATFLEILHTRLSRNFPGYRDVQIPPRETVEERNCRLLKAYREDSSEWGWLLARELARSAHILAEYLDAYANEGYLPTATQWDHLRRLVELIDYHPAPPASAVTYVALTLKEAAQGQVKKGLAMNYTPADGGPPLTFETLADVDADAALNLLRPAAWNRNPERLRGHELELDGAIAGVKTGQPLVLEDEWNGGLEAYTVQGVRELADRTVITVYPRLPNRFRKGCTKVHLVASDKLAVEGPLSTQLPAGVIHLTETPAGLMAKQVVWIANDAGGCFAMVKSVSDARVLVDTDHATSRVPSLPAGMGKPVAVAITGRASRPTGTPSGSFYFCRTPGDWSRTQGTPGAAHVTTKGQLRAIAVVAAKYHPVTDGKATDPFEGYTVLTLHGGAADSWLDNPQSILVRPDGTLPWTIDQCLGLREPVAGAKPDKKCTPDVTLDTAAPKKAAAGDLAVLVSGRQLAWGRLTNVAVDADANTGSLTVDRWRTRGGGPFFRGETRLHAKFSKVAQVFGRKLNPTPLTGPRVPLSSVPEALGPGRALLVEIEDGESLLTSSAAIEGTTLLLADALPSGATCHNTTIRGNVAPASHGQTRDVKTLGSGDATRSFQEFVVPDSPVTFLPDPALPSGVRADIQVQVDGRTWQEVASLSDASPADTVYLTRVTEEGEVRVIFGDGSGGRRLPTGQNNIRVHCRVGNGADGNLPAGSLKLTKPHQLVASIKQLLPSEGGAEQESPASLRDNAPQTMLALGRAVSVEDFAALAASRTSIAQAAAFPGSTGLWRDQAVEVVVVPANTAIPRGKAVTLGTLGENLRQFLVARAAPGVQVTVLPFSPVRLALVVIVRVDISAFDPGAVAVSARTALAACFGLDRRKLAQPLSLSEVYAVVENVAGVENSLCRIVQDSEILAAKGAGAQVQMGSDGFIAGIVPSGRQTVYLASLQDLVLTSEVLTR